MGNASSSGSRGNHDESVDYGSLVPQGVYTGSRDWNHAIVSQLIVARKLAPFYRPLEDYDASWDDDHILAARKELSPNLEPTEAPARSDSVHSISSKSNHSRRPVANREQSRPDAAVYRGAVECPICFLYYPPNINHSRCCDQAICTECFVQIKRNEPTTTHLVSEPAACPYCVQDNFGVVYCPPVWRAGMGSDASTSQWPEPPRESTLPPTHKRRQKSYSADSPDVVTTDQIRPDWEAKLAAVRAAVARRANRRIIMRQVGDRLIPVGVTSGRVHPLNPEEAAEASEGDRGSRRRRRAFGGNSQLEQYMSIPGQDLEELMLMEAMRLSLIEHEEHQRKEAEEKRKQEAAAVASENEPTSGPRSTSAEAGPSTTLANPLSNSSILSSSQTSSVAGFPASQTSASINNDESLESNPGWNPNNQRTTPNPPPFSALNAALTSASTAAAILGSPLSRQSQETACTLPPGVGAATVSTTPTAAVPSITVHDNNTNTTSTSSTPSLSTLSNEERPPVPPKSTLSATSTTSANISSSSSSLNDTNTRNTSTNADSNHYGQLPSSPDSGANEPLLTDSMRKLGLNGNSDGSHDLRGGPSTSGQGSAVVSSLDG